MLLPLQKQVIIAKIASLIRKENKFVEEDKIDGNHEEKFTGRRAGTFGQFGHTD